MAEIKWDIRSRKISNGKWKPEAEVFIPHERSADFIKITSSDDLLFETEEEAKSYSERLLKTYLKKSLHLI